MAVLAASASVFLIPASAFAQRQAPSPEQRLERLERQVQQMQRQVFPKGRPADTAGFSDEPAATQSSVITLDQRLDSLERQMSDLLRASEESGHRLQSLEGDLAKVRSDQERRLTTLEQRVNDAAAAAAAIPVTVPTPPAGATVKPVPNKPKGADTSATLAPPTTATTDLAVDAGEDAYSQGFHLWEAGKYDEAIATLRAFTSTYPKHKRASYANNLIGRALLDKGDARGAAEALLANYRQNPKGERAPDSLFYLGQALMQLGQPGQACKAYAELESVYGSKVRPDLQKLLPPAKSQAQCG